jgi:hypothetical protein
LLSERFTAIVPGLHVIGISDRGDTSEARPVQAFEIAIKEIGQVAKFRADEMRRPPVQPKRFAGPPNLQSSRAQHFQRAP